MATEVAYLQDRDHAQHDDDGASCGEPLKAVRRQQ